ncbi:MAG: hypothetical protein Q9224_007707 [Gallowayella concinna]
MSLPMPIRYLHYIWTKHIRRDPIWADLLWEIKERSVSEQWKLVAKREAYRAEWHRWWREEAGDVDVILTVPNATPAVPHGGMRQAVSSCGYTFLFNLLDYTTGIIPITHVDSSLDALPPAINISTLNGVARGAYEHYDAVRMHGLPVGVQVVGQRLQEEKVLAVMERVVEVLEEGGKGYVGLEVED